MAALCGVAGCIPAPAPASPADEAGRPLTLSAIYTAVAVDAETATAAPRRTIEARAAARRRPATGEYLTWAQGHGRGSLHVDNGSERDLVLRLVDVDSRDVPCIVYVRAGEGFTVGSLPPGAYEVRYGLGTGYDPESGLFDKDANYARMVGSVTFAPADAVDYAQYTLTLDDRGGYGDTRPLGATEFVG